MNMFKLGVISDSHGDIQSMMAAVKAAGEVDAWAHLGDYDRDGSMLSRSVHVPVYIIRGNNDYFNHPLEITLNKSRVKMLLCHGHKHNVKQTLLRLYNRALELECDIALYGHTHIASVCREGKVLLVNPGCLNRHITSTPSFAIISVENGEIDVEIIKI